MNEPFITIIVPAYNSEKIIRKCIESLLAIDYPNYEIFIVDDGSTDKTKEILSEYKGRINIIESQHFGPSHCRNIAAKIAKGEFLAFTDADCLVDKNWLKELMRGFINDKVVSVGGSQLSPQDETDFGKRVQEFFELTGFLGGYIKQNKHPVSSIKHQDLSIRKASHNPSCNSMYRKGALLEIGGFDEDLWPGEDVDLDHRLNKKGFTFMYNPQAIVYHYRPQSLKELSRMMYRYGVMQGILTKRYGFFRRIQFLPLFFLSLLILIVALPQKLLWFILFLYLVMLWSTRNPLVAIFSIVFLFISLFTWNLGFFVGISKIYLT
jgi:cellulose synthase/poly-beta-1,6-N-acetylglucosamine synthase-like glycosyltransferase